MAVRPGQIGYAGYDAKDERVNIAEHGSKGVRYLGKRTIADAAVLCLVVLGVSACCTVHGFHTPKFLPASPALEGDATHVQAVSEHGSYGLRIERDGIVLRTQFPHACSSFDANPGVHMTALVTNLTGSMLRLDEDRVRFSRFPPHQRAQPDGTPLCFFSVEPAERQDGIWLIPAGATSKIHAVFGSPARTPGYVNLALEREDTGDEYVYGLKIARVPPLRRRTPARIR